MAVPSAAGMSLDSPSYGATGRDQARSHEHRRRREHRSPDLCRREVAHIGARWRDAECRFGAQLGGDRHGGCDIAVVEDLVKARAQELLSPIPAVRASARLKGRRVLKVRDSRTETAMWPILSPSNSAVAENLVSLWMAVDNLPNRGSERLTVVLRNVRRRCRRPTFLTAVMRKVQSNVPRVASLDGCDEKRTPRGPAGYFLPCILTASIDAAAASGSR